jgi:electron-transferring-flavoprotein dehydrogenase
MSSSASATSCRWLGQQAEALGVEIYPGFAGAEVLFDDNGAVRGVATGDMGIGSRTVQAPTFQPGMELHAKYTFFAEGCRGHLGKQLIARFNCDEGRDPQTYGIGLKELWEIDPKHQPGLVMHSGGWPLDRSHVRRRLPLSPREQPGRRRLRRRPRATQPYLSPYEEFQRYKTHPEIRKFLEGGKRIAYGARPSPPAACRRCPSWCSRAAR